MYGGHRDKDALARAPSELPRPPANSKGKAPAAASGSSSKIVTYVLGENRVYVALGPTLEEAINLVFEAFPAETENVSCDQIQLRVGVRVKGEPAQVTVSRSAWKIILPELKQYELIHVAILDKPLPRSPRQEAKRLEDGSDAPPSYSAGSNYHLSPDSNSESRSRSPSPGLGHRIVGWLKGDSD